MAQLTGRRSSRFLAEQAEAAALEAAFVRAVSEWEADPEAAASLAVAPVDWECDPPEWDPTGWEPTECDPTGWEPAGWEPTQSGWPTAPQADPASGLADVLLAHGFPAHVTAQLLALADSLTATNPTSAATAGQAAAPGPEDAATGADDVLEDGGSYRGSVLSDAALTAAAEASVILGRWAEDHLLTVLSQMSLSAGRALLDAKEVTSPDELSKTARLHWRRDTKSALAAELELLTGKGRQICHDLIGIALAPPASTAHARAALAHGDTDLTAVRTWFDRCRSLTPHEAAEIAATVFHTPTPDQPDDTTGHAGQARTARQSDKQFRRDLNREVTRAQGSTPQADAERRKAARAQRHASVRADDDGTACLTVRGPTSAVIAAWDRIDVIARKARAAGDSRTIAQLRADATTALLIHGLIPGAAQAPQAGQTRQTGQRPQAGQAPHGPQAPQTDDCATTDPGPPLVDLSTLAQISAGTGPVQLNVILPLEALLDPDSPAVGELADHGTFLTAGHLRELALQPGCTLFRVLTDPATGACLERSTKGYRPDKAMLELLRAMDVLCRAPGCTTPAARCQLDHERPYDHQDPTAGGRTSAANLTTKDQTHHNDKTKGLVTTLLNPATREITWHTLFGRIYATWPHDYTQYTSTHCPGPTPDPAARPSTPQPAVPDLSAVDLANTDLRDRLIYAALTERTFAQDHTLAGWDDHEDADPTDLGYPFTPEVDLLHHTPGGAPRRGPDPTHPTTHDLLHPDQPDPNRPDPNRPAPNEAGQQDPPAPDQDSPRPPF